jgi:hypothetical protein
MGAAPCPSNGGPEPALPPDAARGQLPIAVLAVPDAHTTSQGQIVVSRLPPRLESGRETGKVYLHLEIRQFAPERLGFTKFGGNGQPSALEGALGGAHQFHLRDVRLTGLTHGHDVAGGNGQGNKFRHRQLGEAEYLRGSQADTGCIDDKDRLRQRRQHRPQFLGDLGAIRVQPALEMPRRSGSFACPRFPPSSF